MTLHVFRLSTSAVAAVAACVAIAGCGEHEEETRSSESAQTDGDGCITVQPPGLGANQLCNSARGNFRAMHDKYDGDSLAGESFGWLLEGETTKSTWGVPGNPSRTHVVFERVLLNSISGGRDVGVGFGGLWANKRAREGMRVANQNWEESIPRGLCTQMGGTFHPETGHCMPAAIQAKYDSSGGANKLERHGFPLSELVPGVLEDGSFAWVQYTEKSRFEIPVGKIGKRPPRGKDIPFPPPPNVPVTITRLGKAFIEGRIAFDVKAEDQCEAESCTCSPATVDIVCASPLKPNKIATMTWRDIMESGLVNIMTVQQPEAKSYSRPGMTCDQVLGEACMGAERDFTKAINANLAAIKDAMTKQLPTQEAKEVMSDPLSKCQPFYRPVLAQGSCE